MALPLKSLLRYWRAALLDSNRHIDPNSLSSLGVWLLGRLVRNGTKRAVLSHCLGGRSLGASAD
ncbi:hypothetical protein FHX11_005880 [Rhizobium sp. BK602]|nr:hypothetical protein [Rhizobium sp. BK602]